MRYERGTKGWTAVAAFALLFGALALSAAAKERYEEKFERTEALAKDGRVYLGNISGDIAVGTWDKAEVRIEALKVSQASSAEKAKENAAKVTIEITREGSLLRIETKYPERKKFWGGDSVDVSVDYKLWIPSAAGVEVKSVSGDVDFEAAGGPLKARVVSGSIGVKKAAAGADLDAVSGDLVLSEITGDVFLKTVSGDITVNGLKGSVEAESVSGDVELKGVAGASNVDAKALSGTVEYRGRIEPKGRYQLKSHSGDVRMFLPADAAFDLEGETFSGVVDSEFKIEISGKLTPKEVQGTVNGGGAQVRLKAFSGSIDLKKI